MNILFLNPAETTVVFDITGVFVSVDSTPRPLAAGERLLVSQRSVEFVFFVECYSENFCSSVLLVLLVYHPPTKYFLCVFKFVVFCLEIWYEVTVINYMVVFFMNVY